MRTISAALTAHFALGSTTVARYIHVVREDGAVIEGYRPREFLESWIAGGKA